MVYLLLSTIISYANVKLHELKFTEKLFVDISTPEDETTVGCRTRIPQHYQYYIFTVFCNMFRPPYTAVIR